MLHVPAGFTGLFKPADDRLQHLIRHAVKQLAIHFFVDHVQRKRINGKAIENICSPTKMIVLCDATPL